MQIARLLQYDLSAAGCDIQYREVLKFGQLLYLFGCDIIREQVELAVAVAPEINFISHPNGLGIVATAFGFGYLHYRFIGE